MTNEKFINSLTDDDVDLLIEKIETRQQTINDKEKVAYVRQEQEYEAKKYCNECNRYLSCRERRKNSCDNCNKGYY